MRRSLLFIIIIIVMLAGCVKKPQRLELVNGTVGGHRVKEELKIIRDKYGFPHIIASNDEDLFYGVGYAMAQDRFFQLDLIRRAGRGELTELVGRIRLGKYDIVNLDKVMRALNYKGRAEQGLNSMPDEAKRLLLSFSAGINKFLEEAGDTIPQYKFFKTKPKLWRAEDSLVCADIFGLAMSAFDLAYEYYYSRIVYEFGEERARIFLQEYPKSAPIIIEDNPGISEAEKTIPEFISALRFLSIFFSNAGSNNWVISPKKSVNNAPIIANDPHVPSVLLPGFWYHCHLQGGSFNIIGMMFPGCPTFGAAYNEYIAWALTNANIDQMDIFREKLNPSNKNQYLYKGNWLDFKIRKELIPRKRKKPIEIQIKETIHGVVIDESITGYPVRSKEKDEVYAFKLVDVDMGAFIQGYMDMARAKDWDSFVKGIGNMMKGPVGWNHLYADRNGNIGYYLSGSIPIRKDNQGWLAREGWTGEHDWVGYVPLEELPHIYNPKKGFLATANNKNWLDGYPYYVACAINVDRAMRITEVLTSKEKFDRTDMEKLQLDVAVIRARKYVPIIILDLEGNEDKRIQKGLKELQKWKESGYLASVDSQGASLYNLLISNISKYTFSDELKDIYTKMTFGSVDKYGLENIIDDPENIWFDDQNTKERETRKDIVQKAMKDAVKYLERRLGKDSSGWQLGKLQYTYIGTTMGLFPVIGKRHLVAKYPREGLSDTVNNSESFSLGPFGYIFVGGPTTRMIVDFSDPGHFWFTAITGNSENPKSGRLANLSSFWVQGIYQPFSMKEEDYKEDAMGTLLLKP